MEGICPNHISTDLGPWMGRIVGSFQSLGGHMSVDLRCGETGVTEEGLHAAQVGSVIEEMRGEGVA